MKSSTASDLNEKKKLKSKALEKKKKCPEQFCKILLLADWFDQSWKWFRQNYCWNNTCINESGNEVMGSIAEPIRFWDVWKNYKAKAITFTAMLPLLQFPTKVCMHNQTLKSPPCKIPYQALCATRNLWFSPVTPTKSHTDLSKTKLCKVLESDAVERS